MDDHKHDQSHDLSPSNVYERFERATRGIHKPKSRIISTKFRGLEIKELNERELAVRKCIRMGLSIKQTQLYLEGTGLELTEKQVYNYYEGLGLTKSERKRYEERCKSQLNQYPHDRYCKNLLVRIVRDAKMPVREVSLNQAFRYRGRYRPDVNIMLGNYRFLFENQMDYLNESKWVGKMVAAIDLWKQGMKFRQVYIVWEGNIDTIRRYARDLLQRKSMSSTLFLFTRGEENLFTPDGRVNIMYDPIWRTPVGSAERYVSLLKYVSRLGQKPH
jgi:hypothetical protein